MTSRSSPGDGDARAVVEYCVNNVDAETRDRLAGLPVEARQATCLERCGTCRTTPFVVVDGERLTAESHAVLLAAFSEVTR